MPDTITQCLESIDLSQYAEVFAEQEIVYDDLGDLTDADLKELRIPLGPRKRLLKYFATLTEEQPISAPTEPTLTNSEAKVSAWERQPGERKPATLLFADIKDSTTFIEQLDAEEAHEFLYVATQSMCEAIENNEGTVCKLMGDGVMGMFGAPVASEHHAINACEAALEMQQDIVKYSDKISAKTGNSLTIRVGLHSGEVVVLTAGEGDKAEYDASGPTVTIAARMEQAAKPGEIYISATTHSLAESRVEADTLEPIIVKGVSEPVPVYVLRQVRSAEEAILDKASTPFVGRRSELNQFRGLLDICIEERNGQTIYVRGEPGIGKTRLIHEFTKIATDKGVSIHRGLVLPFGTGKGQGAIRSLTRTLLGIAPGSDEAERQRAADKARNNGQLESGQAVFINDLLDLPQPTKLRALYDAMDSAKRNEGKQAVVSTLVSFSSNNQPLLAIVEDVHWANAITLAYLSAFAITVAECPVLLVMTSRIEGDQLDQNWRSGIKGSPFFTIDLGPLRQKDSIALISEFIVSTDPLAQSCLERAAGNPLFLEQLLRSAQEGTMEGLPDSIQSLVLARIDRLKGEDKSALQAASVLGQRFDTDALCALLEMEDYDCCELVEHNIVRPEGGGFLFSHALIQESIYGSLVKSQRHKIHRKAAQWFADSDLVLRAEHLALASDEGAPGAFLEAAHEQAGLYRLEKALELVERGLEVSSGQERFSLHSLQGELLRSLGSPKDSIEIYRKAKDIGSSDIERCRASIGIAEGLRIIEAHDELLEELQIAESIAKEHGLSLELARIYQLRGGVYFLRGKTEVCIEANKVALQYAEIADSDETKAQTFSGLGDAEYLRGRMISAYNYYDQCIKISREQGLGKTLSANLAMRGFVSRWQNMFEPALNDFEEALSLSVETGQPRAEMIALAGGEFFAEWGDLDKGERWLKRRLTLARQLGARLWVGQSLMVLGRIAYMRGCSDDAEKLSQKAVDTLQDDRMAFAGAQTLGNIALVTRNSDRRRSVLSEAEELLCGDNIGHNFLHFYIDAMETCLQEEQWDEVDRYAQALEDYTSDEPLPRSELSIARGRALAAFGGGDRDEPTFSELQRLYDEAKLVGHKVIMPALENALSSA
jgi:class 3 adenylate cyclase/tetratricopeptide (TPR) repeat protein